MPSKHPRQRTPEENRAQARAWRIRQGRPVDVLHCPNCGAKGHARKTCPLPPQPGLCQECAMPATHGKLCAEHRERHREKINRSWRRRHPGAAVRVCGRCRGEGHDSRTCIAEPVAAPAKASERRSPAPPPSTKQRWCAWCGDDCEEKYCSLDCKREGENDAMRRAR